VRFDIDECGRPALRAQTQSLVADPVQSVTETNAQSATGAQVNVEYGLAAPALPLTQITPDDPVQAPAQVPTQEAGDGQQEVKSQDTEKATDGITAKRVPIFALDQHWPVATWSQFLTRSSVNLREVIDALELNVKPNPGPIRFYDFYSAELATQIDLLALKAPKEKDALVAAAADRASFKVDIKRLAGEHSARGTNFKKLVDTETGRER
jgi:hypothetical protein